MNHDTRALLSSEVFCNWIEEMQKIARPKESSEEAIDQVLRFQESIRSNPFLLDNFRQLKKKIAEDELFRNRLDKKLVAGLDLLDLGEI